jgi:hypothetical protein
MTLPSSGPIALSNLQTEYGGTNPVGLNEYYAGLNYVPLGADAIPQSGAISMNTFYGRNLSPNYITTGVQPYTAKFSSGTYYGWNPPSFGLINNANVQYYYTDKYGGLQIGAITWSYCYWDTTGYLYFRATGDYRTYGPDRWRVGNNIMTLASLTKSYSNPYTYFSIAMGNNPFPSTAGYRCRVSNFYSSVGEVPG